MVDRGALRQLAGAIVQGQWPSPTCPRCSSGHLVIKQEDVKAKPHPTIMMHPDWEHDWLEGPFTVWAKCSAHDCGDLAVLTGSWSVGTWPTRTWPIPEEPLRTEYQVTQVWPPLQLMDYDDALPDPVRNNIDRASVLFLPDHNAAAGALRAAIESLLTCLEIPGRSKQGKFIPADQRIKTWRDSYRGDPDVAKLFLAVKAIGNHGSHELPDLTAVEVLHTVDLLELAFDKLYRGARLLQQADTIIARQGPSRP